MTEYRYTGPRQHIEARPAQAPYECPWCHRAHAIQSTGQCRYCSTWIPSPKSYGIPRLTRRKPPAPPIYEPDRDGLTDRRRDHQDQDELAPYADLLDKYHVDVPDDPTDDQGDLDDSTPWN